MAWFQRFDGGTTCLKKANGGSNHQTPTELLPSLRTTHCTVLSPIRSRTLRPQHQAHRRRAEVREDQGGHSPRTAPRRRRTDRKSVV